MRFSNFNDKLCIEIKCKLCMCHHIYRSKHVFTLSLLIGIEFCCVLLLKGSQIPFVNVILHGNGMECTTNSVQGFMEEIVLL